MKIQNNATFDITYDSVNLIPFLLFIKTFKILLESGIAKKSKNPRITRVLRENPNPAQKVVGLPALVCIPTDDFFVKTFSL